MKRLRIILAMVFAVSVMSLVAPAPASACVPEPGYSCQCDVVNGVWNKVTGGDLINC